MTKESKRRIDCLQCMAKILLKQRFDFPFEIRIETTDSIPAIKGQKNIETTVRFSISKRIETIERLLAIKSQKVVETTNRLARMQSKKIDKTIVRFSI